MSREPAPVSLPVALTIAGSDSGGGAGIQADLKTMEAHGVFGTSAIASVTAQNTRGVEGFTTLPVEDVEAQCEAVLSDFDVRAVKTGMLAEAPVIRSVAEQVADLEIPVVVDPVMVAASGDRLLDPAGEEAYEDLFTHATLVTPNTDEAEVLTGIELTDDESAESAGTALREMGADAALVKGGHVPGETVRDVLVTADGIEVFEHPRIDTNATHGSGCTLASAITARLALGDDLRTAVGGATAFMERAVRYAVDVGEGPGAVHHLVELRNRAARNDTAEAVEGVVQSFVERDVSALVPEVGMNVVGATPYAEAVDETAAVEGRITRTMTGVKPNRGVRFCASSHVARFLLSARENDPSLRFAVNCRFDGDVGAALSTLSGEVAEFDRAAEPEDVKTEEGSTMGWGARQAFESASGTPVAIIDRGEVGKEAIVKLLAADAEELQRRTLALLSALEAREPDEEDEEGASP
ncbi:bifunctional hydroxymethylpyrimidine kinase/phosphomethylpyrimidine kinase [Haladaptatus sp. R4]|uniref:bifunctional hydroxymethylpyrimidine kinase/phosphomethylpyrimidine kinase n=1 Tax=Haladaptatus sp. R4 TaxID=1679489 RepID=UPI0007B4F008|nr:bifunctional hydroxymethylpyrimidine kinase/phosphomethylpyrimidine kinase [Haladaptatus sp. R4]KZN24413.1 bifunctional hydroxymethylpyrimidine kinase/phosphomethylpyrimidine kinase [Haladaptatus sp. R4]